VLGSAGTSRREPRGRVAPRGWTQVKAMLLLSSWQTASSLPSCSSSYDPQDLVPCFASPRSARFLSQRWGSPCPAPLWDPPHTLMPTGWAPHRSPRRKTTSEDQSRQMGYQGSRKSGGKHPPQQNRADLRGTSCSPNLTMDTASDRTRSASEGCWRTSDVLSDLGAGVSGLRTPESIASLCADTGKHLDLSKSRLQSRRTAVASSSEWSSC